VRERELAGEQDTNQIPGGSVRERELAGEQERADCAEAHARAAQQDARDAEEEAAQNEEECALLREALDAAEYPPLPLRAAQNEEESALLRKALDAAEGMVEQLRAAAASTASTAPTAGNSSARANGSNVSAELPTSLGPREAEVSRASLERAWAERDSAVGAAEDARRAEAAARAEEARVRMALGAAQRALLELASAQVRDGGQEEGGKAKEEEGGEKERGGKLRAAVRRAEDEARRAKEEARLAKEEVSGLKEAARRAEDATQRVLLSLTQERQTAGLRQAELHGTAGLRQAELHGVTRELHEEKASAAAKRRNLTHDWNCFTQCTAGLRQAELHGVTRELHEEKAAAAAKRDTLLTQVNELRHRLGERSREVSADAESIYASASSQAGNTRSPVPSDVTADRSAAHEWSVSQSERSSQSGRYSQSRSSQSPVETSSERRALQSISLSPGEKAWEEEGEKSHLAGEQGSLHQSILLSPGEKAWEEEREEVLRLREGLADLQRQVRGAAARTEAAEADALAALT
ncbi:hypothetical protein T484DRAFT_1827929, partial [Baffinella frigidus]